MTLSKLAQSNIPLLKALEAGPLKPGPLAAALGREVENTRKTLKALVADLTLVRDGDAYALTLITRMLLEEFGVPATQPAAAEPAPHAVAVEIPVDLIDSDPQIQPRGGYDWDGEEQAGLVQSVRAHGVLEPVLVRQVAEPGSPRRRLVAGERRWRAAVAAGLATIPAVFRALDDDEAREIALIENVQRADLTYLQEATAFRGLLDILMRREQGLAEPEAKRRLAGRIGRSERMIEQRLDVLILPPVLQVRAGLPRGAEARLTSREIREEAARVREAEKEKARKALAPAELLFMAELIDRIEAHPAPVPVNGRKTEVSPAVAAHPAFKALERRGLVDLQAQHWQDGRCYLGPDRMAFTAQDLEDQLPGFASARKRPEVLADLRRQALGSDAARDAREFGRYATGPFNGPFALTEAAQAAMAEKAARAGQAEETSPPSAHPGEGRDPGVLTASPPAKAPAGPSEAERAEAAERIAAERAEATRRREAEEAGYVRALEQVLEIERALAAQPGTPLEPLVRRVCADLGLPAPWRVERTGLHAASGQMIEEIEPWRPAGPSRDRVEAHQRLVAALVNSACGLTPPRRGKPPKAEREDALGAAVHALHTGDAATADALLRDGQRRHQSELGRQILDSMADETTEETDNA